MSKKKSKKSKKSKTALIMVPLDAVSIERLIRLAEICGTDPLTIAGSLLHDLLEEDLLAHQTVH
jgi:hypothetical protein